MEEALTTKLLANVALDAIVGNRINWLERPQVEALPAITLTVVSGLPDYAMGGATGYTEGRVQVDCWAADYLTAKQTARAVRTTVSGLRFTQGATEFQGVFLDAERDSTDEIGAQTIFRTTLDLLVHTTGA